LCTFAYYSTVSLLIANSCKEGAEIARYLFAAALVKGGGKGGEENGCGECIGKCEHSPHKPYRRHIYSCAEAPGGATFLSKKHTCFSEEIFSSRERFFNQEKILFVGENL
jgi:hypothetical protein